MSKRSSIVEGLVTLLKSIDGTGSYTANLFTNVYSKFIMPGDANDFPTVSVVAGRETREYHPAEFKWAWLTINIRIYVEGDNCVSQLENIFTDIETVVDANNEITYETGKHTEEIRSSLKEQINVKED